MRRFVATHVRSLIATNVAARASTSTTSATSSTTTCRARRTTTSTGWDAPAGGTQRGRHHPDHPRRDPQAPRCRAARPHAHRGATLDVDFPSNPSPTAPEPMREGGSRSSPGPGRARAELLSSRPSSPSTTPAPGRPPPPPRVSPRRLQWDHQVAALSGEFRCLRPDMWGCGSSPELPDPLLATLDGYAAAVLRSLDAVGSVSSWRWELHGRVHRAGTAAPGPGAAERAGAGLVAGHGRHSRAGEETGARWPGWPSVTGWRRSFHGQAAAGSRALAEPHIADPVVDGFAAAVRRDRACQAAMAAGPTARRCSLGGCAALVIQGDQDAILSVDEARDEAAVLRAESWP